MRCSVRRGMKWQLDWVSELSKLASRTWGGIPGEDDVGSSDTLWQRRQGSRKDGSALIGGQAGRAKQASGRLRCLRCRGAECYARFGVAGTRSAEQCRAVAAAAMASRVLEKGGEEFDVRVKRWGGRARSLCFPHGASSQCNAQQRQTLVRLARMQRARARPEATTVEITRAKPSSASGCSRLALIVAHSFPAGALTVLSISRQCCWARSLLPSSPFVSSAIVTLSNHTGSRFPSSLSG